MDAASLDTSARNAMIKSNTDRNRTHDRSTGVDKSKPTKRTASASGPSSQSIRCDGCGKLNHGTHPDFNKTGAWIGYSSYKKIAE